MTMATVNTDFYKMFHNSAYHPDITKVYSNYTSRNGGWSNVKNNDTVVFVGLQYFIKDVLIKEWNETFFDLPKSAAIGSLKRIVDNCLGFSYDASHFESLHDLGYLPLNIKALPEGSAVPYGVPPITFVNTVDGFQWLSNFIETVFSTENWIIQTSATTAREYLRNTVNSFDKAGLSHDLVPFMCHDFSMRGMAGRHTAAMSGFGHLCSFAGTDTIPAIVFAEKYYNADVEKELVGASVPATEHSTATSYIMSMADEKGITKLEAELEYVRYLMTKVPTGILSHVSDSFDFWEFVSKGLPLLKDEIMARDGQLVVRPDSGDPVEVLCGKTVSSNVNTLSEVSCYNVPKGLVYIKSTDTYCYLKNGSTLDDFHEVLIERTIQRHEVKGLVQCLIELFGYTTNEAGYKVLDSHIGAIYGDSITLERQQEIIDRLLDKGIAPTVVLGIGSYSYQYVTRDTHGSAVKATWVEKAGKGIDVFKDPKTDSKKKSAKGLLRVEKEDGTFVLYDQQTKEQEQQGLLETVFLDGKLVKETSLQEIRQLVKESL